MIKTDQISAQIHKNGSKYDTVIILEDKTIRVKTNSAYAALMISMISLLDAEITTSSLVDIYKSMFVDWKLKEFDDYIIIEGEWYE